MKTVTITHNDLKKALSKPWSTNTCLLATTARRLKMFVMGEAPATYALADASDKAEEAMQLFDRAHDQRRPDFTPTKRRKLLAKLRKMLPIRVKL